MGQPRPLGPQARETACLRLPASPVRAGSFVSRGLFLLALPLTWLQAVDPVGPFSSVLSLNYPRDW